MFEGAKINRMFSTIAGRYDCVNHLTSCGLDFFWRRRLAGLVKKAKPQFVVDLATGSGDVAFVLKRVLGAGVKVVGMDFCQPMLDQAEAKKEGKAYAEDLEFRFGDGMDLPLADNSVDAITISFGFRNFENRKRGLEEMKRVLKPGGTLFIMEFTQPYRWFRGIYYWYLKKVLMPIGRMVSGRGDAYDYLVGSIEQFPEKAQIAKEIEAAGFSNVRIYSMTFGAVAIHRAVSC